MKRTKYLIQAIRRLSENEGVSTETIGISDEEILQYINDAQDHLFDIFESINPSKFLREDFIDVVANQESYALPSRIYLDQNILSVEFSSTGRIDNYYILDNASFKERDTTGYSRTPCKYLIRNGQILLNPIPSSGITNGVRVNYVQKVPNLDKRRAQIDSVTVSSGQITALSVDITDYADYFKDAGSFSSSNILVDDYFCIVSSDGTIKARNIPITAISASNGDATVPSYTPESTSETASVGDYLVAGKDATTHSELPDNCERFIIHYANVQMLLRDGNPQLDGQYTILDRIEKSLKSAWENQNDDVVYPPIVDDTYLIV